MKYGIFVESNEDLGLMYKSYKDIPKRVKEFMDFVNKTIDYAMNKGIPEDDIKSELTKFKEDVKTSMIKPSPTGLLDAKGLIDNIKKTKDEVNGLIDQLGKMRKTFRFGDNLIKGVIIKPKIYRNTTDEDELARVNKYMNQASNALDWIEKVLIDLANMCDQDLNLASVSVRLYFRECHDTSDFMEEFEDDDENFMESVIDDNATSTGFDERFNHMLGGTSK